MGKNDNSEIQNKEGEHEETSNDSLLNEQELNKYFHQDKNENNNNNNQKKFSIDDFKQLDKRNLIQVANRPPTDGNLVEDELLSERRLMMGGEQEGRGIVDADGNPISPNDIMLSHRDDFDYDHNNDDLRKSHD